MTKVQVDVFFQGLTLSLPISTIQSKPGKATTQHDGTRWAKETVHSTVSERMF
jgi:hypothetical protein